MFFTIFSPSSFIILLSVFAVVVLVVVAPFILAGITVSDGTHDVAVAALETAGNLVPKGGGTGGLHDVGLDMNVHAFAKGSTFSVNMAESQRVYRAGGRGKTGRCVHVCVCMDVCE